MDMLKLAKRYNKDEDGAVTVDWVVLTAAVVSLGLGVLYLMSNGTTSVGDRVEANLGQVADRVPTGTVIPGL